MYAYFRFFGLGCVFFGVFFSVSAQISIDVQDKTVRQILKIIEKRSKYVFFYNDNYSDLNNVRTVCVKDVSIGEALNQLFSESDLTWEMKGDRLIVLVPAVSSKHLSMSDLDQQAVRTVTGVVSNEEGEALGGVTVALGVGDGRIVTVTDVDGRYELQAPNGATIVFSSIGYDKKSVLVDVRPVINVRLHENSKLLSEVLSIGYGTVKGIEATGSVSGLQSPDFMKGSITDVAQLVKNKVAGLTIVNPDADPTGFSQILLRGVGTLKSSTTPLVVIDGLPGNLSDVVAEDIESFYLLKDGAAAAIYGSRGSNGVMMVNTKKVTGETVPTIEYSGYLTTQSVTKKLEMMNASEYRNLVAKGYSGAYDYGSSTDWLDEVFRTPVSHTHNVCIKSGNADNNYLLNVNYKALQGLIQKSDNEVFNGRMAISQSMYEGKLRIKGDLLAYNKRYAVMNGYHSTFTDVYRNALVYNPTDPVKDTEGNWTEHVAMNRYMNPLSMLYESSGMAEETSVKPVANATFSPFPRFTIKALASFSVWNKTMGYAETSRHINSILYGRNGYAQKGTERSMEDMFEMFGNYTQSINKHHVTLLVGYDYQKNTYAYSFMSNYDFTSDYYTYNNMGNGTGILDYPEAGMIGSYKERSKLVGFFSRINYNYHDTYLLMVSVRREGSSKFAAHHQWGTFPAVSAGWNLMNEAFAGRLRSVVNTLKFRCGFGITGTIPYDSYRSLDLLKYDDRFYNYQTNSWVSVFYPSINANKDLKWEKKEEVNVGLDVGVLENRMLVSVDWYRRMTKDLLWTYHVSVPQNLYNYTFANGGSVENRGVEAQLRVIPLSKANFKWNSNVGFSTNASKMVSFSNNNYISGRYADVGSVDEPSWATTHRVEEGSPIGNFYGWKSVDVDENGKWIIEGKDGSLKPFINATAEDRKILGNGLPKYYLTWNNTLTWKRFDWSVSMHGAFAFQLLNLTRMYYSMPINLTRGNVMKTTFDNVYGKRPLSSEQTSVYVSYYIENGDYWKVDNCTLGYTFEINKGPVKAFRVYASASNVFTITGYSGIDPEVDCNGLTPGVDERYRYPSTRSYTMGVSLKF